MGYKSRLESAPRNVVGQEGVIQDQTDALSRRCLRSLPHGPHCTSPSLPRPTFDCRDTWRKSSALSCSARPPGKDPDHIRTLSSRQVWLAPPAYELCVQRLRWYQSIAREPARHAHLLCCWFARLHFESHDTLIKGLRLHPEANGYAKRILGDLQTLAFVPEWAEQVANLELEFGDVFRLGSKLNEGFSRWI